MLAQVLDDGAVLGIVIALPHLQHHILFWTNFLTLGDRIRKLEVVGRNDAAILRGRIAAHVR